MKKMMCITAIITAFMLLMPLAVLGEDEAIRDTVIQTDAPVSQEISDKDIFMVFQSDSGEITEMSAEEYIFGVVAAEMPALYDTEALKAQAVASYTYACYKREQNKDKDYDITTDFTTDQSYKNIDKAREDWGDKAEEYVTKIKSAINEVKGQRICYKNEPILAVYHAVSCGQTYSAKEIWGKEIAYLESVSSGGDKLANNYTAVVEFSEGELKEKLSFLANSKENIPLLGTVKAKASGLVESVKVYGEKISGSEVRSALSLPSANFKFEKQNGNYIFTCFGYGHGVGMSQKGADYMAKQGYNYKQILSHYYQGTSIK